MEDFVMTLIDDEVILKAKELMETDRTKDGFINAFPIEKFDTNFRLYKPFDGVVNLEFISFTDYNKYYYPVGFYKNDEIYILNEFAETYNLLVEKKITDKKVKFLSLKENAVIAAFSVYALEDVREVFREFNNDNIPLDLLEKYDKFTNINGLSCEILLCEKGYPQLFLNDKYNFSGHIGAYIPTPNGLDLAYRAVVEKEVEELKKQELLTAFTKF